MDNDHDRQDHGCQENEAQGRTMSRRRFLAICAGAVVLAGGGWALSRTELAGRLAKHALGAAQVQVRPDERVRVARKQDASVFGAHVGQLSAEPQLVGHDPLQTEQGRTAKFQFHI